MDIQEHDVRLYTKYHLHGLEGVGGLAFYLHIGTGLPQQQFKVPDRFLFVVYKYSCDHIWVLCVFILISTSVPSGAPLPVLSFTVKLIWRPWAFFSTSSLSLVMERPNDLRLSSSL